MDIEGAEVFGIYGMKECIQNLNPKLLLELHPIQINQYGYDSHTLLEDIIEWGNYQVYKIEDYRNKKDNYLKLLDINKLDIDRPSVIYFKPMEGQ